MTENLLQNSIDGGGGVKRDHSNLPTCLDEHIQITVLPYAVRTWSLNRSETLRHTETRHRIGSDCRVDRFSPFCKHTFSHNSCPSFQTIRLTSSRYAPRHNTAGPGSHPQPSSQGPGSKIHEPGGGSFDKKRHINVSLESLL